MATPGGKLGFNPYGAPAINRLEQTNVSAVKNEAVRGSETAKLNPKNAEPAAAPANASAAPKGPTLAQYVGLCDYLNQIEQELLKPTATRNAPAAEVANTYSIKFVPPDLASCLVTKQGPTDESLTPMVASRTASTVLNPETNKIDTDAMKKTAAAGTPILQFIEQTVRNSTYITDQQIWIKDKEGNVVQNKTSAASSSDTGNTAWFKISVQVTPKLPFDKLRRDYARDYVYVISPYGINKAESEYFQDPRYRGLHKVYNYWFTGENTQVLSYEQDYNALWNTIVNDTTPISKNGSAIGINPDANTPRIFAARSAQSDQGGTNGTNDPAANLADQLYSTADQAKVKMRIIGDPAWIQQGEILSADPNNFNFNGFNPDGSINFEASQVTFAVVFNKPADYNLNTGLMEINAYNKAAQGTNTYAAQQSSAAYSATEVRSSFSNGKFEQTLDGVIVTSNNGAGGNLNNLPQPPQRDRAELSPTELGARDSQLAKEGYAIASAPVAGGNGTWDGESPSAAINNPAPQPASPAQAPVSNGDIDIDSAQVTYQATLNASIRAGDITVDQARLIGYIEPSSKTQTMAPKDA